MSQAEVGIAVAVLIIFIIAAWYYWTHKKPSGCQDSTGCTTAPNLTCLPSATGTGPKACGPSVCTAATAATVCVTGANTVCDTTTGSKTFGLCVPPSSVTCNTSKDCTVDPYRACIPPASGTGTSVCGQPMCNASNESTVCNSGENIKCNTIMGSLNYGLCVPPSIWLCNDSSNCASSPTTPSCIPLAKPIGNNKGVCGPVQCTAANASTVCTGATPVCDVVSTPTVSPTYGRCIASSSVRQRK